MFNLAYVQEVVLLIVVIGVLGIFFIKKNLIFFLIFLEITYHGILLGFLYTNFFVDETSTKIYFLIFLLVVATEAIIGLVLVILYQKQTANVSLNSLTTLNG